MQKLVLTATLMMLSLLTLSASGAEGMVRVKSNYSVSETTDKLVSAVTGKGLNVFAEINHMEGAREVGLELRPTQLVIFGNPKVGTPLMQCAQSSAIDLPQKALIWEDADGTVWLAYNDPAYLKKRHGIEGCDDTLATISGALDKFAQAATK